MIIIFLAMIDRSVYHMRLLGSGDHEKNCVGGDVSNDFYGLWWVDYTHCKLTQVMRIILTHLITRVKGWAEVILEIVVNLYY